MSDLMKKGTSMNLFKRFTLKWWQTGVFKLGTYTLGIAIGTYWHVFFSGYLLILVIVAVLSLAYVAHVWWKQ